jgi:hypothetical protein
MCLPIKLFTSDWTLDVQTTNNLQKLDVQMTINSEWINKLFIHMVK